MISAILLSGGLGTRFSSPTPKQYLLIDGIPLVIYSLKALLFFPSWHEIVVVCEKEYEPLFLEHAPSGLIRFARPGKERQDSVFSGIRELSQETKWVCIHDGARPLLSKKDLTSVIEAGIEHGAAALAVPIKLTVKEADPYLFVKKSLNRAMLWEMQTPQVLSQEILWEGFKKVHEQKLLVTDDVSLAECIGKRVKIVQGSYSNIKITTPEDLALAKLYISHNAKLQNDNCL